MLATLLALGGRGVAIADPLGQVTVFAITPDRHPQGISADPDGNLWFTEQNGHIGRITRTGQLTEFSAGITPNSGIEGIAVGSDGNLWCTEFSADQIGRILRPAGSPSSRPALVAAAGPR